MSLTGPLDRVVGLLNEAGYAQVNQPSQVGGIPFEFAAMLAGRNSLDLIILIDPAIETDAEQTRRSVEGLARALDLVRSRRSLTVVFVGPLPSSSLIRAIASVARVLRVNSTSDEAIIRDAIAVLLPLVVATEEGDDEDTWPVVREKLIEELPSRAEPVLIAARSGRDAVKREARRILGEPLEGLSDGDDAVEVEIQ